ncbi:hypothetical protein BKA82DRAFT_7015 [Pisolithus tinctorius]|uniref:Uncharacterized protein n=1 Tax=Pisolithus tinctorius Marx 270 TaxID=870435 RepID=A0A0C3KRA7_PISTI|nr:hypothetical protein BKA82DRAFT_7015 [Pisolithus tinctorius]KIO12077.1 hypothetical protein M404DRAFT_7015 [Pisolithus tinctorius Marx 270]
MVIVHRASSAVYLDLNAIVINMLQDGLYLFKLGSTKPVQKWLKPTTPFWYPFYMTGKHWYRDPPPVMFAFGKLVPMTFTRFSHIVAAQRGAWSYVAVASAGKDWSDYGRMSWMILYSIVCATLAYSLVRLVWYNIPWTWIAAFLIDSIGKVIDLLQQIAMLSYRCLCSLLLAVWRSIADVWAATVSHIHSTLRTFIGLPPVDGFQLPPYPRLPSQYEL